MKKIDRETVQRIIDTADIVEVVSDFVSLKRRGANYIGLCPFHNERTPSFSVSKSKGICKCFSCGKGGSPVNFLMELEQMSYQEALRWLANKYHIEIKEREESEAERRQASEREKMFAVNEFAMHYFTHNLTETDDGRAVGLSYFRRRGISDAMIERFHLGYALEQNTALYDAAVKAGFDNKSLEETGLVAVSSRNGSLYDRFRGRVIYPVHSLSGKVVAFGGRTLRTDKSMAKYVNSPESAIYRKSYELYGMYQARQSISRQDKCILVEGYMDVISMHQVGICNVVASSGTSLTEGQIRMIHRFTSNVTVIYDSDAAGIKASLRGIDLLLAEGLNIKVLLLPDGDDPDSFAQHNPAEVVEKYIADNETDFIRFKTRILLDDAGTDPMKRSQVISDILRSISVIPDAVTRGVYTDECARLMGVKADMLHRQLRKLVTDSAYRQALKQQGDLARSSIADLTPDEVQNATDRHNDRSEAESRRLAPFERALLRLVLKYGNMRFSSFVSDDGQSYDLRVLDYVVSDLAADDIQFSDSKYAYVLEFATNLVANEWGSAHDAFVSALERERQERSSNSREKISRHATSVSEIRRMEQQEQAELEKWYALSIEDFDADFISRIATSSDDDVVRKISTELVADRHVLSKIYMKDSRVPSERDVLGDLLPRTLHMLKYEHLCIEIDRLTDRISNLQVTGGSETELKEAITDLIDRKALQRQFAQYLGDRNLSTGNITDLQRL